MLTGFVATNEKGDQLTFDLDNVDNGFLTKEIEGLDPVKATLVTSSVASRDGVQYQSVHREARDIKLKLGIEPQDSTVTVSQLRKQLYNIFMPKTQVRLQFVDDEGLTVWIFGRVEECDIPHFVEEPEANISIMCFDPDFFDPTAVVITGETASDETEVVVNYEGTVDTGIRFRLDADRELSEFTIYHHPPSGEIRLLEFVAPLVADDSLYITTVKGSKGATVSHSGGTPSSVLYGISPYSAWLELQPGENRLRVYAEGEPIPFTLEYTNKYGGL
jgi:hypothetical protein